ncbi:MAG TPA: class D sortase [Candidatus Angelobacter sp.]|nr:class D sortase [Candidatus Angelobacter sp.]
MNGKRSSSGSWKKIASTVLVMCGLALLGYAGSEYWQMYRSQRELEVQWQNQMSAKVATERPLSAGDMLTRVSIPKISLDAIVVEGTAHKQLAIGPGHIVETAMPGEQGNAVITGHRDTFFRHIYELNKGDEILVRRNGQVFHYRVTGKKIVQPEDVSVLKQTSDAQLTLITCYPIWYIGPAPERLVVFSKLVESGATATAAN